MSTLNNPMLLNPNNGNIPSVPSITSHTPPFAVRFTEEVHHYICSIWNHHMHRKDGKRLAFVFGHFATNELNDIEYLEEEIRGGNPYIRRATDDEIHAYKMKIDPAGTMADTMRPRVEAEVRTQLEAELNSTMLEKLNSIGVQLSDEQIAALKAQAPVVTTDPNTSVNVTDAGKLSGLDRLKGLLPSIKTPTATIIPQSPQLGGIVGTDQLGGGAPDSNSPAK